MKQNYSLGLTLLTAGLLFSCNDNNGSLVLDPATQATIEKGITVSGDGCDTTIVFPYSERGYEAKVEYEGENSNWCMIKDSTSADKAASIIALKVLPSGKNLYARKAFINIKAPTGNTYKVNLSQSPYYVVYPENALYVVSSLGGDLAVKIKANTPFEARLTWRIDGYGTDGHIREVNWLGGDIGKEIEPSANGDAMLHFHLDLNTGWGRSVNLFFDGDKFGRFMKTWSFDIKQEPRTFQATETYTMPEFTYQDPLDVVFGQDKANLNRIKNLFIKGELEATQMDYFANFAKSYSLQTLNLSDALFYKNKRIWDKRIITERMFFGCNCIGLSIPSNTEIIEKEAFADCEKLTQFTIPNTVRKIGDRAFAVCPNLKEITIGTDSELKSIGDEAFNTSSVLNRLFIPATVTNMSGRALVGLNTKELHVRWPEPPVLKEGFNSSNCTLYVPKGCAEKYKLAPFWRNCVQIVEEP